MGDSALSDVELRDWLRWAANSGAAPIFLQTLAEAAFVACAPDYVLLRPALLELRRRYPLSDVARDDGQILRRKCAPDSDSL